MEGAYLPSQGFELGIELGFELGIELGIDSLILNNAEVLSFQKAHVTLYM